ncbi:MAG TPA: GHMP kinase [Candidatus Bathyarchaeia archaeon]|nr:GHMP kinase [Candidatus Bathyarchaeia archaeon]
MSKVSTAKAFSPGHITGFAKRAFVPGRHLLHHGSEGAGFSIDRGVTTTVSFFDDRSSGYQISINGMNAENAEVSQLVLQQYLKFFRRPYYIKIEHDVEIPIGFGLGSSGAAALSLSYALNQAAKVGLSAEEAAQIAHWAEIVCGTGLGTVIAEYVGGFETRTRAGAPGLGIIRKIELKGYKAIILCMGPISTKLVLRGNSNIRSEWRDDTPRTVSIKDFVTMSYEFVSKMGLTEGRCKEPIKALRAHGFDSSVALFGDTIFTIVPEDQVLEAAGCLGSLDGKLFTCGIDNTGARVL